MKRTMWMVAAAALLTSSVVSAQPMGGPGGREGLPVIGRFMGAISRLDLSGSQRELIAGVIEEMEADLSGMEDRENGGQGFMEYFCSDGFDAREFESMLDGRLERMRVANGIIAGSLAEIRGILTGEQLDELAAMREEHAGRPDDRGHHREGMAPPPCGTP